jgi:peptide/nickel transport system substrate-binding protein
MKIYKQSVSGILKTFLVLSGAMLISCHHKGKSAGNIFRYNEQTGIATLDPAFAKNQSVIWAVHQVYNTLVETDCSLRIVPSLAKKWEISADGITYTFHLRTDVFFQDNVAFPGGRGRKMIAADVRYSLNRILDPNTASSGTWVLNGRLSDSAAFSIPDDSTVILRLKRPFSPMLGLLTMQYCSIVPHEVTDKYGKDFRSHPCGTGPFELKSWEEGEDLILVKNPHYFERDSAGTRLPYLDAVKISFFDNKATEFLLFRQGLLDFTNDIDASFKDEILNKKGELKKEWEDKIVLSKHPQLSTEYLGILVDTSNPLTLNSPLRLRKVRQAINYGFDRRKMMTYLRNSIGTPAESGFLPAGLPGVDIHEIEGYHYDPDQSRRLLADAGFPEGKGLPGITLTSIDIYADMANFIAKQLEEIGLHVKVDLVQKAVLLEEAARSRVLLFRASWIADYPDPENFLAVFYSKNPAPPNYTRYSNPAYDRLYNHLLEVNNDSARRYIYREMDQLMIRDAPVVPLWYDEVIHLVSRNISGFVPNGLNLLELRRVRVATPSS